MFFESSMQKKNASVTDIQVQERETMQPAIQTLKEDRKGVHLETRQQQLGCGEWMT